MTSAPCSLRGRLSAWIAATTMVVASSQFAIGQAPPKNFIMHDAPIPVPAIKFDDAEGRSRSVTDFRGKIVLLNIWATWCGPCRKEMPALDRLQAAVGISDFEVVALSIDRGGLNTVRKFFAEVGIRNLAMYVDSAGRATRELNAVGLPTTLLVDRDGREIGRLTGPAEWDLPETVEFVRRMVTGEPAKSGRSWVPAVAFRVASAASIDQERNHMPDNRP